MGDPVLNIMDNKNFNNTDEEATFVATSNPPSNTPSTTSTLTETPSPQQGSQSGGPPPDYFTDDLPPAYQVASALPTYEESELTKGMILKRSIL